jgi:penicillin V acylase-like amidase (Ntn superfamily)
MKIFVIYDSEGFVWERAHKSLQSVIDVVTIYVEQGNVSPMKMATEFTYKYAEGCVLIAHSLDYKFCIFSKELAL